MSTQISISFTLEELKELESGLAQLILDGFAEDDDSAIVQALNKITQAKDDLENAVA